MPQNYITARKSYALVSGKGSRLNMAKLSLPAKIIGWIYIIAVIAISIGIPYFSVISTSLINLRGVGFKAGNFTFQHYIELFYRKSEGRAGYPQQLYSCCGFRHDMCNTRNIDSYCCKELNVKIQKGR